MVWDTKTGKLAYPPLASGYTAAASFTPDGSRIATFSQTGIIQLWNAETGESTSVKMQAYKGRSMLSFNKDGTRVLTIGDPKTFKVFDLTNGKEVMAFPHAEYVLDAAFSPDGKHTATATVAGDITIWNMETGKPIGPTFGTRCKVRSFTTARRLEFSADGSKLLTAGWDSTAQVWDAKTGKPVSLPMRHLGEVTRATFSPDSRLLATSSDDGVVRVWDAQNGQPVTMPMRHDAPLRLLAFSPDSRRLVTSTERGPPRIWDLSPDARSVEEIAALSRLLANRKLDDRGVLVPLGDADELQLWKRFNPRVK
jgi:WD40 repeat protein